MEHFDLIVIGSGPAGRRAAIQAAKLGKDVLVIENRLRVGGVSVHTGTIPSKTLRETVLNLSGWRERGFYGLAYRVKKDIEGKDLGARLRMTLDHEIDVLEHQFARNGVKTIAGRARFLDSNRIGVSVDASESHEFDADKIVIAVGTTPYRPAHIPFNGTSVVDSDNIAADPHVPKSLAVVGAGVIGLEYATIYSALDVPVTLVEPREQFLEFIDREIIEEFVHELRKRGMQMRIGVKVEAVEIDDKGFAVSTLSDGRKIRTEMLLYAAGRIGATADLGLETCGLAADDRGRLKVDPQHLPDHRAAHLRRRRRHRLPEPRLDQHGAGPHRRVPRLRCRRCRRRPSTSPMASTPCRRFRPSVSPRQEREGEGHPLRSRHRAASAKPRAATSWACSRA